MTGFRVPRLATLAVLALALACAAIGAKPKAPPAPAFAATVAKVVDGDTVHVRPLAGGAVVKVRVRGIDCPESSRNARCKRLHGEGCAATVPAGKAATKAAKALLPEGATVQVHPRGLDKYRRTLADLRLPDGRDFGAVMLTKGCAPYKPK